MNKETDPQTQAEEEASEKVTEKVDEFLNSDDAPLFKAPGKEPETPEEQEARLQSVLASMKPRPPRRIPLPATFKFQIGDVLQVKLPQGGALQKARVQNVGPDPISAQPIYHLLTTPEMSNLYLSQVWVERHGAKIP